MKILYGVQGTGNGHISRARKMAAHLRAHGADVTYLISGRERERLFDMECFGDFEHRTGLTMVQEHGAVLYAPTLLRAHPVEFIRDVRALDVAPYDLIISDFEPVTAWAAKLSNKTCMGIGHQYAFGNVIPRRGDTFSSDMVMKYFAPVDIPVGLHWHHFDTDILPPIIDTNLQRKHNRAPHILVYLPFEDQTMVTQLLQRFDNLRFVQYSPDLTDGEIGNVSLRRTNLHGFRDDLCHAEAVICNAGFELVSECLHMGIPALVKPVKGQMEQMSNALALQQLGWGSASDTIDYGTLKNWLYGERRLVPVQYPDVAAALVEWVLDGVWDDKYVLCETLWDCTRSRAKVVARAASA
ncbi:MAG TPA: MJ1255/VC2487 family glycosyltransferase [Spongiibacteraceae bacterium]|nr:MJ1255/VC2487 family glycosyltransferase [Spongiibacteraceae bacterium]